MANTDRRPKLGGLSEDDTDRIRAYGLSRGFLPTQPDGPSTPPAPAAAAAPSPAPAPVIRPAPTKPWQAMFPDYLIDELRQAAAREGSAQKVIVLRALRDAGYRVDDIDLQDLRKR